MRYRPKVTTFGAGCDPCPGLPRCCASPYCCCRAARAALRTATGNGNRERAGALNPLSWAAGASAAGRLPCLASPFFGGDSKAACRRLASQLAAHSATIDGQVGHLTWRAGCSAGGRGSQHAKRLAVRSVRATAKRPQFDKAPVTVVCRCLHGTPPRRRASSLERLLA